MSLEAGKDPSWYLLQIFNIFSTEDDISAFLFPFV